MELSNISLRRKLFGNVKGGWSRPLTIEQFVQNHCDDDHRMELLKDSSNIKFISSEGDLLDHEEGVRQYHIAEAAYLESFLDATFSQVTSLSF